MGEMGKIHLSNRERERESGGEKKNKNKRDG